MIQNINSNNKDYKLRESWEARSEATYDWLSETEHNKHEK